MAATLEASARTRGVSLGWAHDRRQRAVPRTGSVTPSTLDGRRRGARAARPRARRLRLGRAARARRGRRWPDRRRSSGCTPSPSRTRCRPHQRPKVEPYDDMLFLVLKTLWYVDERDEVETGQVSIFVGRRLRRHRPAGLGGRAGQRARRPGGARRTSWATVPSAVVYSVVRPDRRRLRGRRRASSRSTSTRSRRRSSPPSATHDSHRIYVLKREIAEVRHAVHAAARADAAVRGHGVPVPPRRRGAVLPRHRRPRRPGQRERWRRLDTLLSTAFEAHLARISVDQNEDMRKISAWVAIAGVCTLVAGIYGMNFEHMPELGWQLGYPLGPRV